MQLFTGIIIISLFFLTIIVGWKKSKILNDLTSITSILQLGAFFDIWSFVFRNNHDESLKLVFLYTILFPLHFILCYFFNNKQNLFISLILFFLIPFFCFYVDYKIIYTNFLTRWFWPILILNLIAIITSFYRCCYFKIRLKPSNYFYFLLLGFLLMNLFYYLGFYDIIDFKIKIWMIFINSYLIYLNVIRIIYIIYVSKNY
jgi:hypothetical protein